MKLGLALRVMGPASTREILHECAVAADEAGIDDLWVADHIAIPPDDAEGSGGRYLDPLSALAWLAGSTRAIGLGTGVLILPYRPPLPTAKAIATVQELSGGRLRKSINQCRPHDRWHRAFLAAGHCHVWTPPVLQGEN